MAYRIPENMKPPAPEDALLRFSVRNGATMRMTFGCYYRGKGHDPHYHDYINWPSHDYHPGPICQMLPPRDDMFWRDGRYGPIHLDPIHLAEEEYTQLFIEFENEDVAQYLTAELSFNEEEDNYINVKIDASMPFFQGDPQETRFTLFIRKTDDSVTDAVCHGIVSVLPGAPVSETPGL